MARLIPLPFFQILAKIFYDGFLCILTCLKTFKIILISENYSYHLKTSNLCLSPNFFITLDSFHVIYLFSEKHIVYKCLNSRRSKSYGLSFLCTLFACNFTPPGDTACQSFFSFLTTIPRGFLVYNENLIRKMKLPGTLE